MKDITRSPWMSEAGYASAVRARRVNRPSSLAWRRQVNEARSDLEHTVLLGSLVVPGTALAAMEFGELWLPGAGPALAIAGGALGLGIVCVFLRLARAKLRRVRKEAGKAGAM